MNPDATVEPDKLIADAIGGAEEISDPLAGLAEKTAADPGAPFMPEALRSALNVIEAKAHFDAPERQVHIRVGGLDGRLYLDLGDETWRASASVAHPA